MTVAHKLINTTDKCFELPFFKTDSESQQGNWELDLNSKQLQWSDYQYKIYGYEPNEINLNNDFFVLKTTHCSEVDRITRIINDALQRHEEYSFKRRIVRKNGSLGFVETHAKIIRSTDGVASKILGITKDISNQSVFEKDSFNNPQFFDMLYANYKKAIFSEIFRLIQEKDISNDLCQEVFIKAWNNIFQYNHEKGELYTWLIQIARNHCKDYFRSKSYKSLRITTSLDSINQSTVKFESSNLDRVDINKFLLRLNPEQKEIIELLFLQGFSQSEVAKMKNLPLGSVKTKSRSALKTLREIIS